MRCCRVRDLIEDAWEDRHRTAPWGEPDVTPAVAVGLAVLVPALAYGVMALLYWLHANGLV